MVPITYDRFANQPFDPTIHRPVCRYQPPPPPLPPPELRLPPLRRPPSRPWTAMDYWWRHCAASRPTVHFKGARPRLLRRVSPPSTPNPADHRHRRRHHHLWHQRASATRTNALPYLPPHLPHHPHHTVCYVHHLMWDLFWPNTWGSLGMQVMHK